MPASTSSERVSAHRPRRCGRAKPLADENIPSCSFAFTRSVPFCSSLGSPSSRDRSTPRRSDGLSSDTSVRYISRLVSHGPIGLALLTGRPHHFRQPRGSCRYEVRSYALPSRHAHRNSATRQVALKAPFSPIFGRGGEEPSKSQKHYIPGPGALHIPSEQQSTQRGVPPSVQNSKSQPVLARCRFPPPMFHQTLLLSKRSLGRTTIGRP